VAGSEAHPTGRPARPVGRGNALRRRVARVSDSTFGWMLSGPAALFTVAFLVVPILYGIGMAFRRINLTFPDAPQRWIGLDNFEAAVTAPGFTSAVVRTGVVAGATVALAVGIGLASALLLNESFRGRFALRVLMLLPWVVAPVVTGIVWKWIFNRDHGVVNAIIAQLGLGSDYRDWLATPATALAVVIIAEAWRNAPLLTLFLLAGLQGIPESRYRAAKMDGANWWARFRFVTLPGLKLPLLSVALLQTVFSLQAFDTIYAITKGGPAQSTTVLNYLSYQASFRDLDLGEGAALACIVFVAVLACSALTLTLLVRGVRGERR
jgi:multiple sugar transport system permease protein